MANGNDIRGWVMTTVSGIACVFGASIICVDVLVRLFPGQRNFRIQDSNAFLSSSLSLSFGVMLFSALYGMLPSATKSLQKGGLSPQAAQYALVGLFMAGVVGIQIFSGLLHRYIPSHVVDCDHTHDEESLAHADQDGHDEVPHRSFSRETTMSHAPHVPGNGRRDGLSTEHTPLLPQPMRRDRQVSAPETTQLPSPSVFAPAQRPSMTRTLSRRVSNLVNGAKASCDENGPCYGYSDPCGRECFKHVALGKSGQPRHGSLSRPSAAPSKARPSLESLDEGATLSPTNTKHQQFSEDSTLLDEPDSSQGSALNDGHVAQPLSACESSPSERTGQNGTIAATPEPTTSESARPPHHHHVPTNAFLSIGLQTSIAIALHKLPEGFITYATNHANPKLGFAVFIALFIHNITEGFAMALPLYLALDSKWKAMLWSSLLGGISQPMGAAVAALWFKLAGRSDMAPGEGVYGGMFAVTSGIMTSVALQLFSESLGLTHNRTLCIAFAFVGMGVLGISFALTAE